MSDDSVRLDEDGSQTDGGVKRAGRARICKQCKFTTTNVREFSNHRLYAHAEENTEEKSVVNRKASTKRRSSATVIASADDQKNKGTSFCETVEEVQKTKEASNETTEIENQKNSKVNTSLSEENSLDTQNMVLPEKNHMDSQIAKTVSILKVEKEDTITETETRSDLHKAEREKKMDNERISDELLDSLALAPKKISSSAEIRNGEKNMEMLKRQSAEKITIEKQNGMTEEVLLIKRDEEPDDEPRLVIADDGSDIMDHSGLEPHSLFRTGNIQNRTYLCNLCDYSTTNAKSYLHHQKDIHHPEIIIYECDICDYATKYKQKLPRHRKLHFSGKDGFIESDLDSSLTERELREMKENSSFNADFVNGEEEMDDEGDMEYDEEEEIAASLTGVSPSIANQMNEGGAPVEKKKRIRQEVDPLKYFEVMDENGVKYACSKCGNVYKWRKSLNKHWKEKHFGEVPDLTKPPPTLQNYTLFSRYKPKAGGQPPPHAAPNVVYGAAIPSPTNQSKSRVTPTNKSEEEAKRLSSMVMPRQIGPFISSSSPEFFHNQLLSLATQGSRMPENHHEMRRMIDELQKRSNALKSRKLEHTDRSSPLQENSQNEPIDYSKPLDFSKKPEMKYEVKSEPTWGDNNSESADSLQEIPISMSQANSQIALAMKQSIPTGGDADNPVLQCNKCSFVAKTLVDYSAHMSLHLNKRAFKCAECQSHFNGVEELNKHFLDNHSEKIQEHKEAIQKIPHGLQQTYHLLKMPLDSISNLSTQELLSNEPKQLKCSMCHFVAKWPAELQKHAVSHSEERPFVCMVCGSTYKWKWDLVKHFEKSHNSLPNPYKRREGGVAQTGTSSPSTPPLESMSRAASALMEENMAGGNYTIDYETPPLKKRRLSETEFQDTDDFYRELLERQIKHRREMAHSSDFLQIPNRPHSAPFNKNGDSGKEDYLSSDSMDSFTPKHLVAEALKHRIKTGKQFEEEPKESTKGGKNGSEVSLPYKCSVCEYRARWPSEISQHMKNHSTEKPFHCPRCSYKSKWKWDVVKHLRRCGGGTVHDVIDTSKMKKMAPPNVMVLPQGNMHQPQIQQNQKLSPGQAAFQANQRTKSLSPAINTLSRLSNTNFSVAAGGQDHQAMMDLLSQNGHAVKSLNGKQNFNGFESDGLFHCLECPFVGNSHAELKRHAVLHSENKPFSCNMCGYSSRWKCDLKKHMKVYNHFDTPNTAESNEDMEITQQKFVELEEDSDEEKSTLYMCPQCPYNSYKKSAYDHHLRIHGNLITPDNDIEPLPTQKKESSPKFKCTKCSYQGNDLSSFLQHKRSHGNQPSTATEGLESRSPVRSESRSLSPAPSEVSNRTLHLKHRRKPVKQFHCNRCPYICFKRSALINHENLHQSQGNDAYLCMFCDYNVFSKNLLLQHMRLHPEYNPAEGSEQDNRVSAAELMEMEELEEKELAGDDRKEPSIPEENNNIDEYESGFGFMSRQNIQNDRISTPANLLSSPERSVENNNVTESSNDNINGGGLPCEWCSSTFPNVVTLYQHAQSLHPTQLKAQEAGDIAAKQAPSKASQLASIVKDRQREYQVYHQTLVHQPQLQQHFGLTLSQLQLNLSGKKLVPLAPKPQVTGQSFISGQITSLEEEMTLSKQQIAALNARKSASQQKRGRSFQCTKCSFTAPNAVTYLRHIERHGSNCKHTCLYCDYSIDRLNLLYQHMKGTHGTKWTGTTEEKIHLSIGTEDSNNNIIDALHMPEETMVGDELNVSSNSSTNDLLQGEAEERENIDESYNQLRNDYFKTQDDVNDHEEQFENGESMSESNQVSKPFLQLKGNTIFKGVVIQVCSLGGKKNYKCPRCIYVNNNAANTANHVKQHGQQKKYACKHCDYSVDNYKHIQHHMETVHPKELDFVIINSSQSDIPEEVEYTESYNNLDMAYECSKCPYRGTDREKFDTHVSRHSGNGKYECQLCDYSVDKYPILRQHAKLHKNKFLSADEDMDEEEDTEMLDTNTKVKDKNLANASDNDRIRFKCSCCPYFTYQKNAILGHRLNHINKLALSCQLCTFSSNDNLELQQHLQFHQFQQGNSCSQSQDFTLDPYNDSYKLIEQLPDDNDDAEMEKSGDTEEDEAFAETPENIEEFEEDPEVIMMEEELRETYGQIPNRVGMNLNAEGAFDNDIQFRTFKCKLCPYSSNSNAEFKKHCRLHGSKYKFKCDYCDYSLDRVNLISQHRKLHYRESEFDATPLMKTLLNKDHEDYENMLAKVGEDIAFPPSESSSKSVEDILEFNSYSQKIGFDDKIRYVCNKCPYRCQALKSFKCHMQMHGLSRKYKCDYCDWSAERLNLLCQHRKVHASEPDFDPNPGDIQFLNREYILDSEGNSDRTVNYALTELGDDSCLNSDFDNFHPEKNRDKKLHYCKLCPFKTDDLNSYSYHKKLHCIQALYNCSECSYSINNITSLKEHIKLHKKEREMLKSTLTDGSIRQKCPKCPYNSPNKNLLVSHMAMHSSGRKYACNQCDFSTDQQKLLELHLKVHEEGYSDSDSVEEEITQLLKRTPDVIGPKLYFSSSNFNDMDSDSNDMADLEHKCEKCPFSTPSKDELGNHVQHHDSQTKSSLNCTFCTFSCSKEDELLQHAQIHFPSTKLDWDMMKQLRKQHQSYRKNLSKSFPDSGDMKETNNKSSDESGEPDSTVHDNGKLDEPYTEKDGTENKEGTTNMKTKVYVCQFCEREFSCKTTMLQHEKQHLVGS